MTEGWTGKKCPQCKGTGEQEDSFGRRSCTACGGTGEEYGEIDPSVVKIEEPPKE